VTVYSKLQFECRNFRVKLNKAQDVDQFLQVLNVWRAEKKKAENVLLDEIENDIFAKEKFITE